MQKLTENLLSTISFASEWICVNDAPQAGLKHRYKRIAKQLERKFIWKV